MKKIWLDRVENGGCVSILIIVAVNTIERVIAMRTLTVAKDNISTAKLKREEIGDRR